MIPYFLCFYISIFIDAEMDYEHKYIDFFDWDKWEKTLVEFAHIVPASECPQGSAMMTIDKYESGETPISSRIHSRCMPFVGTR